MPLFGFGANALPRRLRTEPEGAEKPCWGRVSVVLAPSDASHDRNFACNLFPPPALARRWFASGPNSHLPDSMRRPTNAAGGRAARGLTSRIEGQILTSAVADRLLK